MAESSSNLSNDTRRSDLLRRILQKYPGSEKIIEYSDNYDEKIKEKIRHVHVLGTPLIEITSMKIHNKNGVASGVFGTIKLIDGEGAEFNLYNRKYEEAETIATSGLLTLTIPKGRAISASDEVRLWVNLEDKNQKTVIAQGSCCWDYKIKNDYEEVQTEILGGKCGYATLHYVAYRHAVVATIDVALVRGKKDDSGIDFADVFGEIIAYCGSNSSILFSKTQNQSIRVSSGTSIDLSRHVVAVPAHSLLVLATKLWNGDLENQIVCQDIQFSTTYWGRQHHDVEGQNGHIKVRVQWSHAYMHPSPESMEKQKMIWANSDQPPSSTLSRNSLPDLRKSSKNKRDILVLEVFSVLIRRDDGKDFNVWGLIQFDDWRGKYDFFKRDQTCAERVLPNQPANIVAPKQSLAAYDFSFRAKLKDADGRIICAGYMHWGERQNVLPFHWYDRHLCSVIRGDVGYMAVYYTLFSDGVQASIRVHYVGEKYSPIVHGSICAEYSNSRYITQHEREYFRNKLFQRAPESCVKLCADFDVPLLKSVVAVPRDTSLIIDVDLTMEKTVDDMSSETFKDRLVFKTDVGHKTDQKIHGNSENSVIVHVEWNEVSLLPNNWDSWDHDIDYSNPKLILDSDMSCLNIY